MEREAGVRLGRGWAEWHEALPLSGRPLSLESRHLAYPPGLLRPVSFKGPSAGFSLMGLLISHDEASF